MNIEPRPGYEWDGNFKLATKDCNGCLWYIEIRGRALCGWGVSFKYLDRADTLRRCIVKDRENKEHSLDYLLEVKHAMG